MFCPRKFAPPPPPSHTHTHTHTNHQVVHGAIKTANLTKRTILPEQGRKEIFLNLGEIYALNFDLLQELEDRIENWYDIHCCKQVVR